MKRSLQHKFTNNVLVKPLYKKIKANKIKPKEFATVNSTYKLDGDVLNVRRVFSINNKKIKVKSNKNTETHSFLRGQWHAKYNILRRCSDNSVMKYYRDIRIKHKMQAKENVISDSDMKTNKLILTDDNIGVHQNAPNYWLRVYPLAKLPEESVCSVIFRCILSQLGLATILVLWTTLMMFVVQNFEGPYEVDVSRTFEEEQNQLVIDLATELRQITPVSPRWKSSIVNRIQEERRLTLEAMSKGARINPGLFWDLSGTFLFIVYVMTALGFGAPVPQTMWGRSCALIYAILGVPIHLYLMMNASMCVVVHLESYIDRCRRKFQAKPIPMGANLENGKESPNCSRNSGMLKTEPHTRFMLVRKILRFLGVLAACRCVPLAIVLYYVSGAVAFGVLRHKTPLEVIMFPLEFTTTGGLNAVQDYVRIMYGFYIEGAMFIVACALTALRRHSSSAVSNMAEKYRLFVPEQ